MWFPEMSSTEKLLGSTGDFILSGCNVGWREEVRSHDTWWILQLLAADDGECSPKIGIDYELPFGKHTKNHRKVVT